jgi:hypothetical protein
MHPNLCSNSQQNRFACQCVLLPDTKYQLPIQISTKLWFMSAGQFPRPTSSRRPLSERAQSSAREPGSPARASRAGVQVGRRNLALDKVGRKFKGGHHVAKHSAGEYSKAGTDIHSNSIEGVFSLIRRGVTSLKSQEKIKRRRE